MGTALTPEARERREELETIIDQARDTVMDRCRRIGNALYAIKSERLYADDYDDFGDYCRMVWDFEPSAAAKWITAAQVADTLDDFGCAVDQLTRSAALALSKTDDPVEVWSEVSAASPSPTALEIERVAELHLPLLSSRVPLTKSEEQNEIALAEEDIARAVSLGRLMAFEKKLRTKLTNLRKLYEPKFSEVKPKFVRVLELVDAVLAELGE